MEATKTCNKCSVTKAINQFPKYGRVCKDCKNKMAREWRAVNKDKTCKYYKKYQHRLKKWKDEHKELMREYQKQYREKKKRELEIQAVQILATIKN